MGKLIYFTPASLDLFIGDNRFDWSAPDDETMTFINDLIRPIGTYLYGRKTAETMACWQTPDAMPNLSPISRDFAKIWQAAEKIVYSKKSRVFDPDAVRALKATSTRDITVGGPTLAAEALRRGLVDEIQLLLVPRLLGGGIRVLPADVDVPLELLAERRFGNGWVYLRYRAMPFTCATS